MVGAYVPGTVVLVYTLILFPQSLCDVSYETQGHITLNL